MNIIELDQDKILEYGTLIGEDIAENIGRKYYRGFLAVDDGKFQGGIIWHYKNTEDECESNIEWFDAVDSRAAEVVFDAYTEHILMEQRVKRTNITIPALDTLHEKDMLKAAGFHVVITESDKMMVTLAELSAMPLMQSRKVPKQIRTVGEITVRQFKKGIGRCVSAGKMGICEDLEYLPASFFERDVSTCYLDSEGEVSGFLLFHRLTSGVLSIQLMICLDREVGTALPGMMRLFVIKMEECYPPDTKVLLDRHNEASLLLSEKLLPEGFGIPVYTGSRVEL